MTFLSSGFVYQREIFVVMLGIDSWLRQTRHQGQVQLFINTSIALSSDVSTPFRILLYTGIQTMRRLHVANL